MSLAQRTSIANESNADFFISLHCNYYEDDAQIAGLECYYNSPDATESKAYAESIIHAVSLSNDVKTRDAKPKTIMFCEMLKYLLFWWKWDFFQIILRVKSC